MGKNENQILSGQEEELKKEIEQFNREKEELKKVIGKIGGKQYSHRDMVINMIFLAIILIIFVLEITTKFLPPYISLEVSLVLISIKIVWMIHSQHRYNHFVFWILNTIEFRLNDVSKRMRTIEQGLNDNN